MSLRPLSEVSIGRTLAVYTGMIPGGPNCHWMVRCVTATVSGNYLPGADCAYVNFCTEIIGFCRYQTGLFKRDRHLFTQRGSITGHNRSMRLRQYRTSTPTHTPRCVPAWPAPPMREQPSASFTSVPLKAAPRTRLPPAAVAKSSSRKRESSEAPNSPSRKGNVAPAPDQGRMTDQEMSNLEQARGSY